MKKFILISLLSLFIGCGTVLHHPAPQQSERRTFGLDPLFIPGSLISEMDAHDGQTTVYLKNAEGEKDSKSYLIFGPMARVQRYDDGLLVWVLGVD